MSEPLPTRSPVVLKGPFDSDLRTCLVLQGTRIVPPTVVDVAPDPGAAATPAARGEAVGLLQTMRDAPRRRMSREAPPPAGKDG